MRGRRLLLVGTILSMLAGLLAATSATDAVDGDPVSYSAGAIHAGNNVGGGIAQLDLPARRVWALVLTMKMH